MLSILIIVMLSVIMQIVFRLSVIMLDAIMLSVMALFLFSQKISCMNNSTWALGQVL